MTHVSPAVRDQVRRRASGRCEYCHKPDGFSHQSHHVDHIISQKHGGSDNLDNLAWACFQCNVGKGSDIAAWDDDMGRLTPLFNPRTQAWDGNVIIGKTAVGRVTIKILQMNHEDQLTTRRWLMGHNLWE